MTERIPTHLDLLDIYTYGLCHKIYSGCDSLLKKKKERKKLKTTLLGQIQRLNHSLCKILRWVGEAETRRELRPGRGRQINRKKKIRNCLSSTSCVPVLNPQHGYITPITRAGGVITSVIQMGKLRWNNWARVHRSSNQLWSLRNDHGKAKRAMPPLLRKMVLQRILILIIHLILQRKELRLKEVESCPRSADGKFQNQLESAGSRTGCSVVSCPDSHSLLAGINPAKWNLTLLFKK